jgi:hypothetical protein
MTNPSYQMEVSHLPSHQCHGYSFQLLPLTLLLTAMETDMMLGSSRGVATTLNFDPLPRADRHISQT